MRVVFGEPYEEGGSWMYAAFWIVDGTYNQAHSYAVKSTREECEKELARRMADPARQPIFLVKDRPWFRFLRDRAKEMGRGE